MTGLENSCRTTLEGRAGEAVFTEVFLRLRGFTRGVVARACRAREREKGGCRVGSFLSIFCSSIALAQANNFCSSLGFEPPTSVLLDGLTSDYTM